MYSNASNILHSTYGRYVMDIASPDHFQLCPRRTACPQKKYLAIPNLYLLTGELKSSYQHHPFWELQKAQGPSDHEFPHRQKCFYTCCSRWISFSRHEFDYSSEVAGYGRFPVGTKDMPPGRYINNWHSGKGELWRSPMEQLLYTTPSGVLGKGRLTWYKPYTWYEQYLDEPFWTLSLSMHKICENNCTLPAKPENKYHINIFIMVLVSNVSILVLMEILRPFRMSFFGVSASFRQQNAHPFAELPQSYRLATPSQRNKFHLLR